MKALCWHGKHDLRYDTVPDPRIEHPRDAVVKVRYAAPTFTSSTASCSA